MAKETLQEFFKAKKAKAGSETVDWEKRKQEWIQAVNSLYKTITEDYLAKAIADGLVNVAYSQKAINEDYIGEYTVQELTLQVADERAVFSPKGRNIVGASGRVDLRGAFGERTLVVQPDGIWRIVATRTPTLKLIPLDPNSLLEALQGVMGQ